MKHKLFVTAAAVLCAVLMLSSCGLMSGFIAGGFITDMIENGGGQSLRDGKIEAGGITVDFGNNSVAKAKLTEDTSAKAEKEDGLASALYTVSFDVSADRPVEVSFPVPDGYGDDPDEELNMGVGIDFSYDDGSTQTNYLYYGVTVENGTASASFVPEEVYEAQLNKGAGAVEGTPARSRLTFKCGLFTSDVYYTEGGHFKINYPSRYNGKDFALQVPSLREVVDLFENTYRKFKDLGYLYDEDVFPMQVYIHNCKDEGAYYPDKKYIEVRTDNFIPFQPEKVNSVLWHEFFHYVQGCYTGTDPENMTQWIDEGTSTYYEARALGQTYTDVTYKYQELAYNSLIPLSDSAGEGYSRTTLFEYICSRRGEEWIKTMYGNGGNTEAFKALIKDYEDWSHDYFVYLVCHSKQAPAQLYLDMLNYPNSLEVPGQVLTLELPDEEKENEKKENAGDIILGETSFAMLGQGCRVIALKIDKDTVERLPGNGTPVVTCEGGKVTVIKTVGSAVKGTFSTTGAGLDGIRESTKDFINYLVVVTADAPNGEKTNVDVQIKLSGMDLNGLDGFTGEWVNNYGNRFYVFRYGDVVIMKNPDLEWYEGYVHVLEGMAQYDAGTFSMIFDGSTTWKGQPGSVYEDPFTESRYLELPATSVHEIYTATKAKDGMATEMVCGNVVYKRP